MTITTGTEMAAERLSVRQIREGLSSGHFVVTVTVTLLLALFESSCGDTVWTVAVFTICWGAPAAVTVSVIEN